MCSRIHIYIYLIIITHVVLKSAALGTAIEYPDDNFQPVYAEDYGQPENLGRDDTAPTDKKTQLNREGNPYYDNFTHVVNKSLYRHLRLGEHANLASNDHQMPQNQHRNYQGQSYPGFDSRQFRPNMQGYLQVNNNPGQAMNYDNTMQSRFGKLEVKGPGMYRIKPEYNKNTGGNNAANYPQNIVSNGQTNPESFNLNTNTWLSQAPGRNVQPGSFNSYLGQNNFMNVNNKNTENEIKNEGNKTADRERAKKFLATLKPDPRIVYIRDDPKNPVKFKDGKIYGNIVNVDQIKEELTAAFQGPTNKAVKPKYGPTFINPGNVQTYSTKRGNEFVKNKHSESGSMSYGPGNSQNGIPYNNKDQKQWLQQNSLYQNQGLLKNHEPLNQYGNPGNVLRQDQYQNPQYQYPETQNQHLKPQNPTVQNQNTNPQIPNLQQNQNLLNQNIQIENYTAQHPISNVQSQNLDFQEPTTINQHFNSQGQEQNQNINPNPQLPIQNQDPNSQNPHHLNPQIVNLFQNNNPQINYDRDSNFNLQAQIQDPIPQNTNQNQQNQALQQNLNSPIQAPQNTNLNPQSPSMQNVTFDHNPMVQNQTANSPPEQKQNPEQSVFGGDYNEIPGWNDLGIPTPTTKAIRVITVTTRPPTTTVPTPSTTSPLIVNAKMDMSEKKMGFLTGYVYQLFKVISQKAHEPTHLLFVALKSYVDELVTSGATVDMGQPAQQAWQNALSILVGWGPAEIQPQLNFASMILENRESALSEDIRTIVNIMDAAYTIEEGDILLQTLVDIDDYPSNEPAETVAKKVVDAILQPYWNTPPENRATLFDMINMALERRDKFESRRNLHGIINTKGKKISGALLLPHKDDRYRNNVERNIVKDGRINDYEHILSNEKDRIDRIKMNRQFGVRNTEHRLEINRRFYKSKKNNKSALSNIHKMSDNKISAMNDDQTQGINAVSKKNGNVKIIENQSKKYKLPNRFTTKHDKKNVFHETSSVTNAFKLKHIKQILKHDLKGENLQSSQNYKRSATNKKGLITPKLKTIPNKYDRLVQKKYNYEKSLSNRRKNHDVSARTDKKKTKIDSLKSVTAEMVAVEVEVSKGKTNKEMAEMIVTKTKIQDMVYGNKTNQTSARLLGDDIYDKKANRNENSAQKNNSDQTKIAKSKYLDNVFLKSRDFNGFKDITKNRKSRKKKHILAESSHSDEENELKAVLADTIRHSDFISKNFRQNDDVFVRKRKIRDISSYSDEEVILKNNIYNVFV